MSYCIYLQKVKRNWNCLFEGYRYQLYGNLDPKDIPDTSREDINNTVAEIQPQSQSRPTQIAEETGSDLKYGNDGLSPYLVPDSDPSNDSARPNSTKSAIEEYPTIRRLAWMSIWSYPCPFTFDSSLRSGRSSARALPTIPIALTQATLVEGIFLRE
ncbi:hypothetical protein P153DRAFT_401416 [Dothidotthia symphoricarpi CBS 119687]|uniref:Uncharacterized protein n=1 Tax=Dothidotthia symphoricarpi CBS 119687 TaxID=1392245 RepID=A0A6A5ZVS6_9PLEO|nr:uncharacterized protein P153DRAFT_401416 [Dothidotthia symphoricarpi CBS 119687]KAF2123842.1 hypothetical protein P153DRAFT_401416 [Dothidotthia symphoricarpi CBS 119687]